MKSLRIIESLAQIPAADWDALHDGRNPFISHAFLHGLEIHGCLREQWGWMPRHAALFDGDTLVGAVMQAAHERRVVVVDGFIATSAVLVAHALQPLVLQRCVFAHRSGERGHEFMLQHLGVQALLDLGMRLGEGSGGALAWPLLMSACAILRDMASFESAGVSEKSAGQASPV